MEEGLWVTGGSRFERVILCVTDAWRDDSFKSPIECTDHVLNTVGYKPLSGIFDKDNRMFCEPIFFGR